jgi:hypothetical protein
MKTHHVLTKTRILVLFMALVAAGAAVRVLPGGQTTARPVPEQLTDEQFWELSSSFSEPDGIFRSDNLLSNELTFQHVVPALLDRARQGRIYMGVGPEQNFTYIAALNPAMDFIVDIRHGNLDVHLTYKALFELSKDRPEFVSRLFSRPRPQGLGPKSSVREIFEAFIDVEPDKDLFDANLKAIIDHLQTKHGFPLSAGDREGIEWALSNYYLYGPGINYNSSASEAAPDIVGATGFGRRGRGFGGVTYADLMMADDGRDQYRSYLATEENFLFLKNLETRNLLVPVVGDFGGRKAIREVGKYLKNIDAVVSAFYLSNVEQYLSQDGKTSNFLANVASLPLDETSTFIRSGNASRASELGSGTDTQINWLCRLFAST